MYRSTHMCVCVCMFVHVCVCVCLCVYVSLFVCVCLYVRMAARCIMLPLPLYSRFQTSTPTYAHTHAYTHTYTHTPQHRHRRERHCDAHLQVVSNARLDIFKTKYQCTYFLFSICSCLFVSPFLSTITARDYRMIYMKRSTKNVTKYQFNCFLFSIFHLIPLPCLP